MTVTKSLPIPRSNPPCLRNFSSPELQTPLLPLPAPTRLETGSEEESSTTRVVGASTADSRAAVLRRVGSPGPRQGLGVVGRVGGGRVSGRPPWCADATKVDRRPLTRSASTSFALAERGRPGGVTADVGQGRQRPREPESLRARDPPRPSVQTPVQGRLESRVRSLSPPRTRGSPSTSPGSRPPSAPTLFSPPLPCPSTVAGSPD